jgi:hypothetical protein
MRSPNLVALMVAVAVLVSGCASAPKDSVAAPTPSGSSEFLGALSGHVVDDELEPVADAQVALASGTFESVRTDALGAFRLEGLPPGPDTLYVAAIGFEAVAKKVDIVSGETTELSVSLADVATDEPFAMLETHHGFIACGSGAGLNGSGFTQVGCGANDPNQQFLFNYTFGKGLKGILFEMTWSPVQALSRDLVINVEKDGCGVDCNEDDTFAQLQGCCYLRVPVTIGEMTKPAGSLGATDFRADGGRIQTRTFPAFGEDGSPVTIFTQQQFEIRAEYFYKQLPPDWDTRSNVLD